jgi:hypothetical protein
MLSKFNHDQNNQPINQRINYKSDKILFPDHESWAIIFCQRVPMRQRVPTFPLLTPPESQREDWYVVTDYIAEFWCCISNIGFFMVCYLFRFEARTYPILMAAICSTLSHAIPFYPLFLIDKAAMYLAIFSYLHLWRQLWFFVPILFAANQLDMYLARQLGIYPWPHVLWHLFAALIAYVTLITQDSIN